MCVCVCVCVCVAWCMCEFLCVCVYACVSVCVPLYFFKIYFLFGGNDFLMLLITNYSYRKKK